MSPEKWRRIEALYHSALEQEPAQRSTFLADACRDDDEVRQEVESLLENNESPLDEPVSAAIAEIMDRTRTTVRLSPGANLGPYRILELLGEGGMGSVFKARDERLDRTVAIKLLRGELTDHADARERFQREARAISAMNHPNVCALFDIGEHEGNSYLVMEYVEGETLAHELRKGKMATDRVLLYGEQIADALAAAHGRGIVHRDLKPGNIMLTTRGVKVLDFGLAKFDHQAEPLTKNNAVLGTPAYMAPEQLEGKACDWRTDIYALGLVLREMATGKRSPVTPSQPPSLETVVKRCLADDPNERWQSAHDVKLALDWVRESPPTAPIRPRLNWAVWLLAGFAAIIALALMLRPFGQKHTIEPVFRFVIEPPAQSTIDAFALSPDGRWLAFSARQEGRRALWLRSLESLSVQRIPGSEDAFNPFWSPDSRSIAFFTTGKLKRIDINSESTFGSVKTLYTHDTNPQSSGIWSPLGVILFHASSGGPVRSVPADGGVTEIIGIHEPSFRRLVSFLPGGKRYLVGTYLAGEEATLLTKTLNSSDERKIEVATLAPQFVSVDGGYLLSLRNETLIAQPFDPAKLELKEKMTVLAEHVGKYSVSEKGTLAHVEGRVSTIFMQMRRLSWTDWAGTRVEESPDIPGLNDLAVSPNGQQFASVLERDGGNDLWLIDASRWAKTRLSFHANARQGAPLWSPDGTQLIYSSNVTGNFNFYSVNVNESGGESSLVAEGTTGFATSWSPDGRFLIFHNYDAAGGFDLWVLPMQGERKPIPLLITKFSERQGQLSPDGQWLAYTSDESGQRQVYVRRFGVQAGKAPSVLGKWTVSTDGGHSPKWSRDGKKLFYISEDRKIMAVNVESTSGLNLGRAEVLFDVSGYASTANWVYRYDVSPDGKRFLVAGGGAVAEPENRRLTIVLNWTSLLKK